MISFTLESGSPFSKCSFSRHFLPRMTLKLHPSHQAGELRSCNVNLDSHSTISFWESFCETSPLSPAYDRLLTPYLFTFVDPVKIRSLCVVVMESLLFKKGSLFAKKSAVDLTDVVDVFTHRCHDCAALLSGCGYLFLGSLINEGRFLRCLIDRNDSQFRRYRSEKTP